MRYAPIAVVAVLAVTALFVLPRSAAQEPGSLPETKAPQAKAMPAPAPAPHESWEVQHERQLHQDWAQLERYREANLKLAPPAAGEQRVVFMGDSITDSWNIGKFFPGKPYIGRGISGQTTPQMVVRMRQDVIDLKPKAVVILAGTNDIAGNTGPETPEQIEGYIKSMAELAVANHIEVVLCSILPAFDYPWKRGLEPAPKIVALNAWIRKYAAENGHVFVDYHAAMKDERDGLPAKLSGDGVHPNDAGYAIMAPLAEAGIAQALGK
ncbi:MAG: SGNH/GDSL hydrolase family protein [Terracidiphilus sp.]